MYCRLAGLITCPSCVCLLLYQCQACTVNLHAIHCNHYIKWFPCFVWILCLYSSVKLFLYYFIKLRSINVFWVWLVCLLFPYWWIHISLVISFTSKVNSISVLELSHSEVVALIQGLPKDFRLVVARKRDLAEDEPITAEAEMDVESQPNESERPGERTWQSEDFSPKTLKCYLSCVQGWSVVWGVSLVLVKANTLNVYGAL